MVNNFIQYTIVPMVQNKLLFDVSQYTLLISFLYVWFEPIVFGQNSQVIPCISFITSDKMTMSHKASNPLENLCQLGCQTSLFPSIEGVSFVSPDIANRFSLWFDFQSVACLWLGMTLSWPVTDCQSTDTSIQRKGVVGWTSVKEMMLKLLILNTTVKLK